MNGVKMNVLKRKIVCIAAACLICLSSCKIITTEELVPKDIYYDIERIKVDIVSSPMKDMYDPQPFEQLQEDVMKGKVNRMECIYRLKKILSGYNVSHLNLWETYEHTSPEEILLIPFQFRCFGNDYHIVTADAKYSTYLGWKLKGIGDLSLDEAIHRVAEYSSLETPTGTKYCLQNVETFEQYYYMGLTDKGKVRFTFESEDGKRKVLNCKPSIAGKIDSKSLKFVTDAPFSRRYLTDANYGIKAVPEHKTIYIPFNRVDENTEYRINDLFTDILHELKTHTYDTIVFDLRSNSGGNLYLMYIIGNELYSNKEELQKYNIALVATGRTYSAACIFIDQALRVFPDLKIFGEETGQAVFNYTYVRTGVLKKLKCAYYCPTSPDDVPELVKRSKDMYRGTMPDVEVFEEYTGFLKGEDTIYKAIYTYFNKQ